MKKPLMLLIFWLLCQSSYSQIKKNHYKVNTQPITTTGISLPQLITKNINRSELQFGVNLSQGIEHPTLSANYKKIISDDKKQLTIIGGALLDQSISLEKNDNEKRYSINGMSISLGADLKLFNKNDYFIQIGTFNRINKAGGLRTFDFFNSSNSMTIGVGKGRIDFVNDSSAAQGIAEKLSQFGVLTRDLTEEEFSLLVEKINMLKNRRRFVNRSYPLTEAEEIQDQLASFGVIDSSLDISAIINDVYQYEPMMDRTLGSQMSITLNGSFHHSNYFNSLDIKSLAGTISYSIHTPISSKWQYNRGASGYFNLTESDLFFPTFTEGKLRKLGIGIDNDLHYLINNRSRLSLLTTTGYDLVNKQYILDPTLYPNVDNKGIYINLKTEYEYQMTRIISTTFGINLNISSEQTNSGLYLGLKF